MEATPGSLLRGTEQAEHDGMGIDLQRLAILPADHTSLRLRETTEEASFIQRFRTGHYYGQIFGEDLRVGLA